MEKSYLHHAEPDKGRFRSFLLGSVKHYLHDQRDRQTAQKRGGTQPLLHLDFALGEQICFREPADNETPERIFEKRWVLTLVASVLGRLESEATESGKREHFDQLKPFLMGNRETPYEQLAEKLNTNAGALKVAIHRMRKRYRELFRLEIAETVAAPEDVDDEIRYLLRVLEA